MPISSVGSGAGLVPPVELPGRESRSAEGRRATVAGLTMSAPGDGERAESESHGANRVAEDVVKPGLTYNRRLQFEVDRDSNEVIVKVIDKETDEVVKVLPPEELQRLRRNRRGAIGPLISERM